METVKLVIVKNTHTEVVLENENGDRFIFSPNTRNGGDLYDFIISGRNKKIQLNTL
jgi:hypothetical protein